MAGPIAAVLFAAAAAAAPHPQTGVVTEPDWSRKPTYEEVYAHYPRLLTVFGVEGAATIRCDVTKAGDAAGCKVVFESPAGLGFGSAALELAPLFKFRPKMIDGKPVEGGTVRIPIHFNLEGDDSADTPAAPAAAAAVADPQTHALCLRLAERVDADLFKPGKANWAEIVASQIPAKTDENGREQFLRAYEEAQAELAPQIYARRAELCAHDFSRKELEETVRFLESPSGRAFMAKLQTMSPEMSKSVKSVRFDAAALAVKKYCTASPTACPDPKARVADDK